MLEGITSDSNAGELISTRIFKSEGKTKGLLLMNISIMTAIFVTMIGIEKQDKKDSFFGERYVLFLLKGYPFSGYPCQREIR